jgi:hypothetical protein
MEFAPIVLFTYNRPIHTRKTLEALSINILADQSILYIFVDGAKENSKQEDLIKHNEVKEIIREKNWCKEVHIIEREKNYALADNIVSGVTEIVNKYGKVIVLEDDIVTSKSFLSYMNQCLEYYEDRPTIFSISAYNQSKQKLIIPDDYDFDVYLSIKPYPWGWGTWLDRWRKVDWGLKRYSNFINNKYMVKNFSLAGDDLLGMLKGQIEGKINSWWIRFLFYHFENQAYTIQPSNSMVNNIGMDGSGVHSWIDNRWDTELYSGKNNFRLLDVLYKDERIENSFRQATTFSAIRNDLESITTSKKLNNGIRNIVKKIFPKFILKLRKK